jgi:hypothetical protein
MLTRKEYEDFRKRLLNFTEIHFSEDVKYTKEDFVIFANSMLLKLLDGYTVAREIEDE